MAFTATLVRNTVFGNERVQIYDVTADAQSGVVACGIYVDAVMLTQVSMTTNSLIKCRPNINHASAASIGNVMLSGCTSGDRFFLMVYGH